MSYGRDVGADEPQLSPALLGVRLSQRRAVHAQRLHLGADEQQAGLHALEQREVVPRLPVVGNDLGALGLRHEEV